MKTKYEKYVVGKPRIMKALVELRLIMGVEPEDGEVGPVVESSCYLNCNTGIAGRTGYHMEYRLPGEESRVCSSSDIKRAITDEINSRMADILVGAEKRMRQWIENSRLAALAEAREVLGEIEK